jgi:DNA polymerase-3 subunit beta
MSDLSFAIPVKVLAGALGAVKGIVQTNKSIPILGTVLVRAEAGIIYVAATDMDVAVTRTVEASVTRDGVTAIPFAPLFAAVLRLPSGEMVEVKSTDKGVALACGRSKVNIQTMDAADFPQFLAGELPDEIKIKGSIFGAALTDMKPFICRDEARYYLNGIYVKADAGVVTFVATTGVVICERLMAVDGVPVSDPILLPMRASVIAASLLDGIETEIVIRFSPSRLHICAPGVTLMTKLIDGIFPDYRRVFPERAVAPLVCQLDPLRNAVQLAAALSDERASAIRLKDTDEGLTIASVSDEIGSADTTIGKDEGRLSGAAIEMGLDAKLLMPALQLIGGHVEMHVGGVNVLIHDTDNPNICFVIAGMRV